MPHLQTVLKDLFCFLVQKSLSGWCFQSKKTRGAPRDSKDPPHPTVETLHRKKNDRTQEPLISEGHDVQSEGKTCSLIASPKRTLENVKSTDSQVGTKVAGKGRSHLMQHLHHSSKFNHQFVSLCALEREALFIVDIILLKDIARIFVRQHAI